MGNGLFSSGDEGFTKEEYDILTDTRGGDKAEKIALARARNLKLNKQFRTGVGVAQEKVGGVMSQSAIAAQQARIQPDFSSEQRMIGTMFGQGEHIWGTNNNPVTINNDLNSSRSDYFDETSSLFGWGPHREKSGLF